MGVGQIMMIAGIGCRRGAPAADVEAAVRAALARANVSEAALDAMATTAAKGNEAGIEAAAAKFGVAVVLVPEAELKAANERTETRSERVLTLTGVHSVAEAAALAAAGPNARLVSPRIVVGSAACALAVLGEAP